MSVSTRTVTQAELRRAHLLFEDILTQYESFQCVLECIEERLTLGAIIEPGPEHPHTLRERVKEISAQIYERYTIVAKRAASAMMFFGSGGGAYQLHHHQALRAVINGTHGVIHAAVRLAPHVEPALRRLAS